ncbi:hypothetical protein THAOC_37842 [Thalassiosira oceanica]|uniref:Uncharacterized protein n=1 Tax=Thalassiosira oceanica TaxID=159749 RepID=K0R5D2_THAOC|nr:hypothetical protein THAOC_37842 [Thalassiosira oceanica]|eukprot:EJK43691.1 hypothetical protein THAOC_37842 [Thalassiosira oceanica]
MSRRATFRQPHRHVDACPSTSLKSSGPKPILPPHPSSSREDALAGTVVRADVGLGLVARRVGRGVALEEERKQRGKKER